MVLKGNFVLMIWYSIQSLKDLNSKFKFNCKHMVCSLFNIIKERVYDHWFIFLEHALVAITIRIILEPFFFLHICFWGIDWKQWMPSKIFVLFRCDYPIKNENVIFILFIKLRNCVSLMVIKERKCEFDPKSGPADHVSSPSARFLKIHDYPQGRVLTAGTVLPYCHFAQAWHVLLNGVTLGSVFKSPSRCPWWREGCLDRGEVTVPLHPGPFPAGPNTGACAEVHVGAEQPGSPLCHQRPQRGFSGGALGVGKCRRHGGRGSEEWPIKSCGSQVISTGRCWALVRNGASPSPGPALGGGGEKPLPRLLLSSELIYLINSLSFWALLGL